MISPFQNRKLTLIALYVLKKLYEVIYTDETLQLIKE
jgi:hypothetical protein